MSHLTDVVGEIEEGGVAVAKKKNLEGAGKGPDKGDKKEMSEYAKNRVHVGLPGEWAGVLKALAAKNMRSMHVEMQIALRDYAQSQGIKGLPDVHIPRFGPPPKGEGG